MSVDFASDFEKKFFADNLLLNEDWDNEGVDRFSDDLSHLLDVESNMQVDDLMKGLPDDLEIPMLDGSEGLDLTTATLTEPWKDFSDGSDSGLDCGSTQIGTKDEPLSPASSHGSDTTDSLSSQFCMETQLPFPYQQVTLPPEVKLESPPLTPPREQDVYFSPVTSITMTSQASAPLTQTVNAIPLQTGIQNGTKLPISRVSNSKVMIQPKPTTLIQPKSSLQAPAAGKPLVLTPEEFAKLTEQGVLKFNPPTKPCASNSRSKVLSPTVPTATLPITPGPAPNKTTVVQALSFKNSLPLHNSDIDTKTLKKQQRMIKNRESACLSRKRKKEYMSGLEQRLQDYSIENEKLKQENTALRKKIELLNSENERLKGLAPVGQAKKITCVLAVMLLLSLNLGSFTGIMLGSNDQQISSSDVHHGRTLLSASDENIKEEQFDYRRQPDFDKAESTLERLRKSMEVWVKPDTVSSSRDLMLFNKGRDSMCPTYFNTTESQRLMNELTGWVLGHKAEQKQAQEQQKQMLHDQQQKEQKKNNRQKKIRRKSPAYRTPDVPSNEANLQRYHNDRSGQYEVQVFNGAERYTDFLDAIHRRNDTFYVVSFRRDHLLLPATAHNKTTRPRMSLVMPAVSLNDSMQPESGHIAMMQIDCEVMATRLVEVSKSAVPHYATENITTAHTMEPPVVPPGPNRSSRYRRNGNH